MVEKSKPYLQWIFSAVLCLPAVGIFVWSFVKLFMGFVIDGVFLYRFWILPLLTIGLVFLLFRWQLPFLAKGLLSVLITLGFLALSFFSSICGGVVVHRYRGEEALARYGESTIMDKAIFPVAETLGSAEQVEYYETENFNVFYHTSNVLICCYAQEDYAARVANLSEQFEFQQEPVVDGDHSCESSVEIGGYTFRLLSVDNSIYYKSNYFPNYFPKKVWIVGQNDKTREIVYISFADDELDYISSLKDHIKNDCGWRYIR